ncbi:RHS repeat-associated protein [Kitasatospora sp. SolWspMP-SS2h]|uniref:RHS repeat-associated core domain-containing protein n=1 Tax=Kitasatospora sp. SolWspMP-SS2h TaxID=1305729 RepID=UPI000DBF66F5|nr:RHS repeat-associated protein [Kitasatospora sp. SolWspMP-SS2h]
MHPGPERDLNLGQVGACTYTPYGTARTTTETVAQPWRYTGAYLDPTGLYKMGARSYDPALGRFTQPDPSGRETNPYAYTAGDPVNHTDPNGLSSAGSYALSCVKGGGMAAGIGLATGVTETGIGAAVSFGIGCASDVATDLVGDYMDEGAGDAINTVSALKDLGDIIGALI